MAKRNKAARYRLIRDIVVQQGIEGLHEPQVTKHRSDCISILLALSRDHTAELLLNREDAVVLGLVEKVDDENGKIASAVARVLRDPKMSKRARSAAGLALTSATR